MEAHHSLTPMILLTTDRPAELRDCGANQTTDQIKIFSHFVRWQTDLPPHLTENYFRSMAAQGVFHAMQNPSGPVQLNCQFREPLFTRDELPQESGFPIRFAPARLVPLPTQTEAKRGVILLGETGSDPRPVLSLAARLEWPLFADILSNARLTPSYEQIRHFDWIIKTNPHLQPDYILHFGNRFASKKILGLTPTLHVSPSPFLQDPSRKIHGRLQCDIEPFCETFAAGSDPSWLGSWKKLDEEIDAVSVTHFEADFPFTEAHAMRHLAEMLPESSAVFLANGMPIRDADHFLFPKKCLGFFGNRGLSGIDGNIATAAGLSEGLQAPVLAFLGDQTCLHDLNSLPLLKKTAHPVVILASNNFGSGIFSHLPIAEWPQFETYMAASHSYRFEEAARMFDIPYLPFEQISFAQSAIVELFTKRDENYRFQKEFLSACLRELSFATN
jgi:2-succinyl-5-enolpyruvyl-6-hydroxy-3-cyclohexene-1-carboxylate synthase